MNSIFQNTQISPDYKTISNIFDEQYFSIIPFFLSNYIRDRRINKMISLKKAISSPILNTKTQTPSKNWPRSKRPNLLDLECQVNKSRIAIENMSHTKALDPTLYKKVEQLQKQLHSCILNLNQQTDKNNTLQDLITLLKGQMNQVQAVQRNEEEYEANNFEKKIKKVQYDIKQILHKYNEEIAKINNLKEQANAARDERVVYSNLFNKIQKEIKHYAEIYKQNLIKNQIFLEKKKQNNLSKYLLSEEEQFQETTENFDKVIGTKTTLKPPTSTHITVQVRVNQTKLQCKKSLKTNIQPDMFLTNIKETKPFIDNFCHSNSQISSRLDRNAGKNKDILHSIEEKQTNIDRIIMLSECSSLEETVRYYNRIQHLNDHLFLEIEALDSYIADTQGEISLLKDQKRNSEAYENRQMSEIVNISKKSRSNKHISYDACDEEGKSQKKILFQIAKLLELDCCGPEELTNDDLLREIDRQIDVFSTPKPERGVRKESRMISVQQMSSGTDRGVAQLLQKIQKFNESEKIFDRNMLKMQYQKQLGKIRKKGKKAT